MLTLGEVTGPFIALIKFLAVHMKKKKRECCINSTPNTFILWWSKFNDQDRKENSSPWHTGNERQSQVSRSTENGINNNLYCRGLPFVTYCDTTLQTAILVS